MTRSPTCRGPRKRGGGRFGWSETAPPPIIAAFDRWPNCCKRKAQREISTAHGVCLLRGTRLVNIDCSWHDSAHDAPKSLADSLSGNCCCAGNPTVDEHN